MEDRKQTQQQRQQSINYKSLGSIVSQGIVCGSPGRNFSTDQHTTKGGSRVGKTTANEELLHHAPIHRDEILPKVFGSSETVGPAKTL